MNAFSEITIKDEYDECILDKIVAMEVKDVKLAKGVLRENLVFW